MMRDDELIRRKHAAQGTPLAGEWETLKFLAIKPHVTEPELEANRISFFLGAYSLLRIMKSTSDPQTSAAQIDAEIADFLESLPDPGDNMKGASIGNRARKI